MKDASVRVILFPISRGPGEQRHVRQALEVRITGEQFRALVACHRIDDGIGSGQLVFAVQVRRERGGGCRG